MEALSFAKGSSSKLAGDIGTKYNTYMLRLGSSSRVVVVCKATDHYFLSTAAAAANDNKAF